MAVILYGCATVQQGKQFTPDEVTWIEKGKTTRAEIRAKFGSPRFEFPHYQSSGFTTTSTATTTKALEGNTQTTQTTTQVQHPPQQTKATYVYTRADATADPFYGNVQTTQSQFWLIYDEKGVVQDYGFLGDTGSR